MFDLLRDALPGTKLCLPMLAAPEPNLRHRLSFPAEDIFALPPLRSVIRSQVYYFRTRQLVRRFASQVDVLFIRCPFQLPTALLGLRKPKLLHIVGNAYNVIVASSDYRGLMKRLALFYAAHSNRTLRRMVGEPDTRVASNGSEMWDLLGCRAGRVVVSSGLYRDEMRPRANRALGNPPRLLFVGYLRPEKGIHDLLTAFEQLRRKRPLKLTLIGGSDKTKAGGAEAAAHERVRNSPFRDDITLAGMFDFGEPLFEQYRNHDVFVLPSLSEGTPRTLVEARSFGCPAVATRVGGVPSSTQDGYNGLLVEPHDPAGLAAAIERILDDEPLRMRLIDAGLQDADRQSVEHFVGELLEEINILAHHPAPRIHARLGSV
ncbi:MAG TPA: glycosyltransferase family 4 protein [Pirellulales bacterium]|nr:glycosyltransferase family 4 protein [Pirellulales bacterium]